MGQRVAGDGEAAAADSGIACKYGITSAVRVGAEPNRDTASVRVRAIRCTSGRQKDDT